MKIKSKAFDEDKMKPEQFKFAHAKYDGNYLEVVIKRSGPVAFTSNDICITPYVRGCAWFDGPGGLGCLPIGTIVAGEVYLPGQPASEVRSAMADPARRGELRFVIFAAPRLTAKRGVEPRMTDEVQAMPLHLVAVAMMEYCAALPAHGEHRPDASLSFAPWHVPKNGHSVAACHSALEERVGHSLEGVVFKNGNTIGWTKWKPAKTIDCCVMGWEPGKGKFAGMIGSLTCGVVHEGRLIEVASVSGMDDAERQRWTDFFSLRSSARWEAPVVEVAYQYVGSGGRLRHPRYVRERDDKTADHCFSDQDPELLAWLSTGKTVSPG